MPSILAGIALLGMILLQAREDADEARWRVKEARVDCAALLVGTVDGVESVGYAGAGSDYRLLVTVRDAASRRAASAKLGGGDAFKGFRLMWTVKEDPPEKASEPPPSAEAPVDAAPPRRPTVAAPRPPEDRDLQVPDCDILRERMGLKRLHRPVGGSSNKSWIPCQVRFRSVLGPGGGHSYYYTSHRPDCPFMNGLASAVIRGSFLWPFELRASDSAWAAQVRQDLGNQFPPATPMQPKPPIYRPPVATGR